VSLIDNIMCRQIPIFRNMTFFEYRFSIDPMVFL
jgi:hypothetical protein